MSFKKKMQIRLCISAIYILIGIILTVLSMRDASQSQTISTFGAVFAAIGIVKTIRYVRLMKNKDAMHSREIVETDERNVMIVTKARSIAFSISIILAGTATIILYLLNIPGAAEAIAYGICVCTLIYLVCYYIIRGKC